MNMANVKEKIRASLIRVRSAYGNLSPRQAKIVGTLATAPIIAIATMDGACAAKCPYGLSYDPHPGQCSLYVDSNGTGACDLASSEVAAVQQTSVATSHSNQSADNSSNVTTVHDSGSTGLTGSSPADGTSFHILPATLIILGAYLLTYYLFKKGILKARVHKRIWNGLLTFGFLGMGITGVILTLMINMGIQSVYRFGLTYLHVELSLLMVLAALIHFHIYRKPFKKMFKVLFGYKSSKKEKNIMRNPGASK
jgi:hypothetical protein